MNSRIVINGASFPQRITGVQRYARELSGQLLLSPGVRLLIPMPVAGIESPVSGGMVQTLPGGPWIRKLGPWGWANATLPAHVGKDELLWSPTIRAPVRAHNHVVTVHDLSVLDHPEWFRRSVVVQWRVMLAALSRTATHFVTDSEFSRTRLLARTALAPECVSVVPCGVDARFSSVPGDAVAELRARLRLPERFILALGNADPRKNIAHLYESWRLLGGTRASEIPLVVAGGTARTFARDAFFHDMPDGVRCLGYVEDRDLPSLYAAASVLAYPSLYEGFGLPPLEAMAAGTPVIGLRSTDAVAEVVGDAALLIEDDSPGAFAAGLAHLLSDSHEVGDLIAAGRVRAASYTWEAAARSLHTVLAGVASRTRQG